MDAMKTGEFLAALRRSHGYTQQQVAELLNLSNKTISKWESGGGFPDVTVLPALAELYGVTADDILAGGRLRHKEEQSTSARHNYLLSRVKQRLRICEVIALAIALLTVFGEALSFTQRFLFGYGPYFYLPFVFYALALLSLAIGGILAHYGLQATADICSAEEIAETRLSFIRQLFSISAFVCYSAYIGANYKLPIVLLPLALLILAVWFFLQRRYGRIFSGGSAVCFLIASICMALQTIPSLFTLFHWQLDFAFPSHLLCPIGIPLMGITVLLQLLPRKQ